MTKIDPEVQADLVAMMGPSSRLAFNNGRKRAQEAEATPEAEPFLKYRTLDEVRERLAALAEGLRNDVNLAYANDYIDAATALEHFSPAEAARLATKLKSRGVTISRWEDAVRKCGRQERERIAVVRKAAQNQARAQEMKARHGQGEAVELDDPEPAEHPVDGLLLVEDIAEQIRKFVVVDHHARIAISLWIIFSYLIDIFDCAPRLAIFSPEMRCGKTTLLELISYLARRALPCSNISPPAIFRTIDLAKPALLIDEADTFIKGGNAETSEELRGILNSGHSRATGYVIRLVPAGEGRFEPRKFSTYTPIVVALIGRLPATLMDRSLPIAMRRKKPSERVERLGGRHKKANAGVFVDLRRRIARWVEDHRDQIAQAEPALPESLNDRESNNWTPLFQIADVIGPMWLELARSAAEAFAGRAAADSATVGVQLLGDLRNLFRQRAEQRGCELAEVELSSSFICGELGSMEDRPWSEWGRPQKPITPRQLAALLKPFGVVPINIRIVDSVLKGYRGETLEDPFLCYLPPDDNSIRYSATNVGAVRETDDFASATKADCSGSENSTFAYAEKECSAVADEITETGHGTEK